MTPAISLRRTLLGFELGCITLLAASCLVIPIPTNRVGDFSRKDIRPEAMDPLVAGQTTREQVLLRLGEPDEWSPDGSQYRYHWEKVKWDIFWIVAGGYSAVGGDIPINKNHDLLISFDRSGVITSRTFTSAYQESELQKPAPPVMR